MKQQKSSVNELVSCRIHFKSGLRQWEYPYFNYLMTLFDQYYKHGTLPYRGSHNEQPAQVIELFEIMEQLSQERDQKLRREQEAQQRKNERRSKRGRR